MPSPDSPSAAEPPVLTEEKDRQPLLNHALSTRPGDARKDDDKIVNTAPGPRRGGERDAAHGGHDRAGIPIAKVLDTLTRQEDNRLLKAALIRCGARVNGGWYLSRALAVVSSPLLTHLCQHGQDGRKHRRHARDAQPPVRF